VAKFKGTVFESTRMYALQTFGPEAVERVLSELPADEAALLRDVQAIGWYPVEPVLHFHHALDRIFGRGDLAQCERAGRFSAGWSMNTVLKVFLRFRSPVWLIDKGTSVWNRYHDTGRWTVRQVSPGRMLGELHEFEVRDRAFCARLRGWLQGAIELTGGEKANVVETHCACHGEARCAFTLEWKA